MGCLGLERDGDDSAKTTLSTKFDSTLSVSSRSLARAAVNVAITISSKGSPSKGVIDDTMLTLTLKSSNIELFNYCQKESHG